MSEYGLNIEDDIFTCSKPMKIDGNSVITIDDIIAGDNITLTKTNDTITTNAKNGTNGTSSVFVNVNQGKVPENDGLLYNVGDSWFSTMNNNLDIIYVYMHSRGGNFWKN